MILSAAIDLSQEKVAGYCGLTSSGDAATGQLYTTYDGHQRQYSEEKGRFEVFALAFSDQNSLALSAGEGKSIRVWEPEKAQAENGSAAHMEERFSTWRSGPVKNSFRFLVAILKRRDAASTILKSHSQADSASTAWVDVAVE